MLRNRLLSICAVLLCVFAVTALPVWGQATSTGTITGVVTDNTGAVVVGATVSIVDKATGDTRSTTTNETGHYIFQNANPGSYVIKFKKAGFAELDVTEATVNVGTQLTENVQMKLGSIATTVTVTETAGAELQTMNATVGQTISGTALDNLPAVGRDATTFITLQPGVSPDGSVAGAVVDQSTFMLDGGNNTNDMDGSMNVYTPSFANDPTGGIAGGGPTGVMPTPIDSVEEFKVNTANQTADFNSSAGAQVEMVTRRGTNQWHGSAYEYYLDNNFDANSFDNNNVGNALPSYHYSRFGARAGGPIVPKEILGGKTYFFANYQGFRWPNSSSYAAAVPSPGMALGLLQFGNGCTIAKGAPPAANCNVYNLNPTAVTYPSSAPAIGALVPGTTYPGTGIDPRGIGINPVVGAMWQKYEPAGTSEGCNSVGFGVRCDGVNEFGFVGNMSLPQDDNFAVVRMDHDFGSKWHFNTSYRYYRLTRATNSQVDIGGAFGSDQLGVPTPLSNRPQQPWFYVAGLTTNITPNVTNDFHYSYLRDFWAWETGNAPPQPGTDSAGVLEPFGEYSTTALTPYNVNAQNVRTRFWDGHDNMLRDDITVLHGNHLFQFGGTYERNWDWHQRTDNGGGINFTLTYLLGDSSGAGQVDMSQLYNNGFSNGTASTTTANRDLAAVLGIVTDSQVAYTRSGANLQLNTKPLTPAQDQSTIPFYNVYFSDSWHLRPTLTVTYGLGWTLEMPPTEAQGRQVELVDSSGQQLDLQSYLNQRKAAALQGQVFNPEVGFALVGNTGPGQKYPYNPFYGSFSPRVAVAWNPQFQSGGFMSKIFGENNTVVRGGYNRIYGRLNGVDLVLVPLLGTGLIQPVQCRSALSTGNCGPALPDSLTAFRIGTDGNTAPIPQPSATLPQPVFPGINDVSAAAGEALDPNFRPNVIDSFDLTIQRQFGPKMIMELGYVGRRITHEYQPININAVPYMMTVGGQRFDAAYAAVETALGCATSLGACGANVPAKTVCTANCATPTPTFSPNPLYTSYFNSLPSQAFFENALQPSYCTGSYAGVAYANCTAAMAIKQIGNLETQKVWSLWSGLDNGGFNFPRSMMNTPLNCPTGTEIGCNGQLSSGVGVNASNGFGNYNGAFVSFRTTDWHGITSQQNFTFSRALGTGAFVQATSEYTPNDPFNLKIMYGRQGFDVTDVYNMFIVYQPPVFKGQNGLLGRVLGGWSFSPIFTAGSGYPLYCNTLTDAQSFGGGDGANFFNNEQCIFSQAPPRATSHYTFTPASGGNPASTSINLYSNPDAVAATARAPILGLDTRDNGDGEYSGLPYWNLDFEVKKMTKISERFSLETQFLFINVLNHMQPGTGNDPLDLGYGTTGWGDMSTQANTPRQLEFGIRLNF